MALMNLPSLSRSVLGWCETMMMLKPCGSETYSEIGKYICGAHEDDKSPRYWLKILLY